jgi:alpha-tubulin suppressor-like RCC1 family protein
LAFATNVITLSSAEGRTSAADASGILKQFGNNTVPFSSVVLSNVVSLSEGSDFTVALTTNGTVLAWGAGGGGELGQGASDTSSHATPVQVTNLTQVTAVAAGSDFAMALRSDGTVWVWGSDADGQMGDCNACRPDEDAMWPTPTQVAGISNAVAIAAGPDYAVVLRADGTVVTWGDGFDGALGTGDSYVNSPWGPMQVPGLTNVVGIAAPTTGFSHYTLAWTTDGHAYSWGKNALHEDGTHALLGTGSTNNHVSAPQRIYSLSNVRAMNAAETHALAVSTYRGVYVFFGWGYNANGEVGVGTTNTWTTPTPVHFPFDTDGDGVPDWEKYKLGLDPLNPYQNGDGLLNGVNLGIGFNPASADLNNDRFSNGFDIMSGLNPFDPGSFPDPGPGGVPPVITLIEPVGAVEVN